MNITAKVLSPLEKVFYDDKIQKFKNYPNSSALIGEKHNFIVAYIDTDYMEDRYSNNICYVKLESDIKNNLKIYSVEHVPSVFAAQISKIPDNYIRQYPGIFPDLLIPIEENSSLPVIPRLLNSLWIEADTAGIPAGKHKVTVKFTDNSGNILAECSHTISVIDAVLPEQDLIVTHWMHTDCIADYYGIKVFSAKYWKAFENYLKVYTDAGNNMIYTPLFTPPLDTAFGKERTTVQLVDVSITGDGIYEFGFEKLKKWISICKKCGIKYFEMSHLFTQWGAFHAPKIIAVSEGKQKKIFGWDTDSHGKEYESFLGAFLPELVKVLEEENISERAFFHISDEPSLEHIKSYRSCSNIIRKYLHGYKIMDAMSNIEFYDEGLVDLPIPYIGHSKKFFEKNIKPRFTYYAGIERNCMGRALSMPSSRNRISGPAFYTFDIDGFLHWGYNFYNSALSIRRIDPYFVTDADKKFCSGDSYLVYPAENLTSYISIRLAVFRDGLQDMRAMKLCEKLCGKNAVIDVIKEFNSGNNLDIMTVPADPDFTLKVREKINSMIKKAISKL